MAVGGVVRVPVGVEVGVKVLVLVVVLVRVEVGVKVLVLVAVLVIVRVGVEVGFGIAQVNMKDWNEPSLQLYVLNPIFPVMQFDPV